MGEEININVKTLDSRVFSLTVPKDVVIFVKIPVPELKKKIQEKTNVSVDSQRLIFQGKVLKDDQTLAAYPIQDGHTLHMVERPAQQNEPRPQTQQAPTQPQPQPQPTQQPQGMRRVVGLPSGVMVGSIAIPSDGTPPDMNQILSNVLNTLGLPGLMQPQQIQTATTTTTTTTTSESNPPANNDDGYGHIRQLLNDVEEELDEPGPLESTVQVPAAPVEPRNNVETLATLLGQLSDHNAIMQPMIERLSQILAVESELADPQLRTEAQQLATRLFSPLQQMGLAQTLLAPYLSTLRVNNGPGTAQMVPPSGQQAQQHILTPNGSVAIHITQSDVPMMPPFAQPQQFGAQPQPPQPPQQAAQGQPPSGQQAQQPGAAMFGQAFSVPMVIRAQMRNQNSPQPTAHAQTQTQPHTHTHTHAHAHAHAQAQTQTQATAQPQSTQTQGQQQVPSQPANPFVQMMGNMFRPASAAPPAGGAPGAPAAGQPQGFNAQGAVQILGPLFQQIAQPLQQARAAPTIGQQQAQQPQANLGQVFSQVFSSMGIAQPQQQQAQQTPQQPAQQPEQQPGATATANVDFGSFMTQMLGGVAQSLNSPAASTTATTTTSTTTTTSPTASTTDTAPATTNTTQYPPDMLAQVS